jgi:cobalt-zinc-cadmium efflux system protein
VARKLTTIEHSHSHAQAPLGRALAVTAVILLVELAGAYVSHSLALLSDAGHVLTDVFALGLAWLAVQQAGRPADERRTYGYHRVGILAALVNATTLILIVVWIAYEAARRLLDPPAVQGGIVVAAALVGVVLNAYIGLGLRRSEADLNVRAALLHVLGDLAAGIGVVVAGVLVLLTGWLYADPLVSLLIAGLIAWGAVRIALETVNVLLEGTPRGIDLVEVNRALAGDPEVESVHDLHVWAVSPEHAALSAHLVVGERTLADAEHLVRRLEQELCDRFGIGHTTIQLESCHPCGPGQGHGSGQHNHPHTAAPRP